MSEPKRKYRCQFCSKSFTSEVWHNRHTCAKKEKFLDTHNISTIQAHRLFTHWQLKTGLLRKNKEKTMDEFRSSPLYDRFRNLAEYCEANKFTSSYKYVDWLESQMIDEADWCNPLLIPEFNEFVEKTEEPGLCLRRTLAFIRDWSFDKGIDTSEFITKISSQMILQMIRRGYLSPWVVLGSDLFVEHFVVKLDTELDLRYQLDQYINLTYWLEKLEKNPQVITVINDKVNELVGR